MLTVKKILLLVIFSVALFATELKVGNSLEFRLNDQFDKKHTLQADTKKLIFAFSKDMGHLVKEYLKTKEVDYLEKRGILFIADISAMPRIIYKLFAESDMKKSKYPILLIQDDEISLKYKHNKEKICLVTLDNKKITSIKYLNTQEELKKEIE